MAEGQNGEGMDAWVAEVDRLMKQGWCIDTADAGLSEEDVVLYWRNGEHPAAFVAWFAEKYDLIRFEPLPVRSALSKLQSPA